MKANPLSSSKLYLFLTEFLVGVCLMGVEIASNRLFTPYVSGSQVVLTIVTVVVMVGMALGNFFGGRLSEKKGAQTRLYVLLAIAGVYVIFDAFLGRYLIAGVSALFALFVDAGLIVWITLTASLLILFPPMLILGMVTPNLVKFAVRDSGFSGKIVGLVESMNTVGSILGTLLPTFVTIPFIGTPLSFALFGIILILLGLIYILTGVFTPLKRKEPVEDSPEAEETPTSKKPIVAKLVLSSLCLFAAIGGTILNARSSFVFWGDGTVIYEGESQYNYLQVKEQYGAYYFSTNVMFSVQSLHKKDGSLTGMYYDDCLMASYMAKEAKQDDSPVSVLVLGNATGTYASLLKDKRHFPFATEIDGVEIDQAIIDLGYRYFDCPKDMNVYCDDGRAWLHKAKKKYDVIMVDAYSSISAPFQMTTVEFFEEVKSHLNPMGVVAMNINMVSEGKDSVNAALCDTASSLFGDVAAYRVYGGSNLEVFATVEDGLLERMERSLPLVQEVALYYRLNRVAQDSYLVEDGGIRLYDSSADVEVRSMLTIDGLIFAELEGFRKAFQEGGLPGLLEYLFN